ncbi:MAG: glycosyltransferase family 4 protein [Aromatoleum sp.]|nr:glycosyltransferase family 4 protein [Aromatoleum sp.]
MTIGVKFLTYPDHSGYGLAALAYVRGLHNAGVPVWWSPLVVRGNRHVAWRPDDGLDELPVACEAADDAALQDVAALARVAGPKAYDTVVFQTVPELWPQLAEPGKRNVGYTVWETDALPPHWLPLLNAPDSVLVPSAMNRALFERAGVTKRVHTIPHIRRHAWNEISPADSAALRRQLGIPDDHFLFYTIGVWDPRKALADLVAVFAREFSGHDKVSLVVKTSTRIHPLALDRGPAGGIGELVRTIVDRVAAEKGRPPPQVALVAADGVAGRAIDTLHATGDCFVSLTHGEGWGMGAFDAAALGKPVLITGYGGPAEYLGPDYPGLLDYTMVPVSGWSAEASFRLPQRWAQVDPVEAGRTMRRMVARYADFLDPAAIAGERILNRYAEPVVVRQLMAALDG